MQKKPAPRAKPAARVAVRATKAAPPPSPPPLRHAAFAARLRLALTAAKAQVTGATSLEREFNQRYEFAPITPQSAHAWLMGKSRPTADKIAVLAEWLGVSAHWLAFGNENDSDAVPLRGKGESSSPYAARKSTTAGRAAGSTARDFGARAEQMLLKFERLTFKQQAMLLTLADELLLTVRG